MNHVPVAFFDFDGTLTNGDSLLPYLKYLVGGPKFYLNLIILSPVLVAYAAGVLRNDVAKQILLKKFLAGFNIKDLERVGREFGSHVIPSMLRPEGMSRLIWHKENGHHCVLVSASLDVYLKHWAMTVGFDGLICSGLEVSDDGFVSGKLFGKNCYGHEKVNRIKKWLAGRIPITTYAYGDTRGDIPMIEFADRGWMRDRNSFEEL